MHISKVFKTVIADKFHLYHASKTEEMAFIVVMKLYNFLVAMAYTWELKD